jgi:alanyl-tRNA synthetase
VIRALDERMSEAARALRTTPEQLARRIETLLEEKRRSEKQVEELLKGGSREQGAGSKETRIGDTTLSVQESSLTDRNQIGILLDGFRGQHRNAIAVLVSGGERPAIHVAVTDDLISRGVKAGDLVGKIASVSGGKGGGRPHFASAGVGDPAKLGETLAQVEGIVRDVLGSGTGS